MININFPPFPSPPPVEQNIQVLLEQTDSQTDNA